MFKSIIAGILAFTGVSIAQAQEISQQHHIRYLDLGTEQVLYYGGSIHQFTTEALDYAYQQHPDVDRIYFHSNGGLLHEGFELHDWINDKGLKTGVTEETFCLSACAIAFLAGHDYIIKGQLGFHRPYTGEHDDVSDDQNFLGGQISGIRLHELLIFNGFNVYINYEVYTHTDQNTFIVFENAEQLMAYYVRDDNAETQDLAAYFNRIEPTFDIRSGSMIELVRDSQTFNAEDYNIVSAEEVKTPFDIGG